MQFLIRVTCTVTWFPFQKMYAKALKVCFLKDFKMVASELNILVATLGAYHRSHLFS